MSNEVGRVDRRVPTLFPLRESRGCIPDQHAHWRSLQVERNLIYLLGYEDMQCTILWTDAGERRRPSPCSALLCPAQPSGSHPTEPYVNAGFVRNMKVQYSRYLAMAVCRSRPSRPPSSQIDAERESGSGSDAKPPRLRKGDDMLVQERGEVKAMVLRIREPQPPTWTNQPSRRRHGGGGG